MMTKFFSSSISFLKGRFNISTPIEERNDLIFVLKLCSVHHF